MLSYPKLGQPVRLGYPGAESCLASGLDGRTGTVVAVATGRHHGYGEMLRRRYGLPPVRWSEGMAGRGRNGPHNHGLLVDGRLVVVPAGHIRPAGVTPEGAAVVGSPAARPSGRRGSLEGRRRRSSRSRPPA